MADEAVGKIQKWAPLLLGLQFIYIYIPCFSLSSRPAQHKLTVRPVQKYAQISFGKVQNPNGPALKID